MSDMAAIEFQDVSKTYPDGTRAVDSLELLIDEGEFMVFVGPSGCGKTTALLMVAGLEEISEGTILIGGERLRLVVDTKRLHFFEPARGLAIYGLNE
jgi:multiple sugar transport system ATP-binding protein